MFILCPRTYSFIPIQHEEHLTNRQITQVVVGVGGNVDLYTGLLWAKFVRALAFPVALMQKRILMRHRLDVLLTNMIVTHKLSKR